MAPALSEELTGAEAVARRLERDHELISRLRERDEAALQLLMDEHGDWIYRLVVRLLAFESESDDVVQRVWLSVWRNAASFRNESSIRTWLFQITVRHTRNHQRSISRWWRRIEGLWEQRASTSNSQTSPTPGFPDPRWETIQNAMAQLKHQDRELLVLVYVQGHSVMELAEMLQEKKNMLEVRLHRAKQRLKQEIQRRHGDVYGQ
ncbi:MAG: RNA polymerase sigma factor [Pirellula sp.]